MSRSDLAVALFLLFAMSPPAHAVEDDGSCHRGVTGARGQSGQVVVNSGVAYLDGFPTTGSRLYFLRDVPRGDRRDVIQRGGEFQFLDRRKDTVASVSGGEGLPGACDGTPGFDGPAGKNVFVGTPDGTFRKHPSYGDILIDLKSGNTAVWNGHGFDWQCKDPIPGLKGPSGHVFLGEGVKAEPGSEGATIYRSAQALSADGQVLRKGDHFFLRNRPGQRIVSVAGGEGGGGCSGEPGWPGIPGVNVYIGAAGEVFEKAPIYGDVLIDPRTGSAGVWKGERFEMRGEGASELQGETRVTPAASSAI